MRVPARSPVVVYRQRLSPRLTGQKAFRCRTEDFFLAHEAFTINLQKRPVQTPQGGDWIGKRILRRERYNMNESRIGAPDAEVDNVAAARARWLTASEHTSKLSSDLFQPGSGYGDPDARFNDEHPLQSAREEAERLFREYHDLDRQQVETEMLELQRSQRLATWASFAVAAVVGATTVVSIVVALRKS